MSFPILAIKGRRVRWVVRWESIVSCYSRHAPVSFMSSCHHFFLLRGHGYASFNAGMPHLH
jgi:hypothetical protein